LEAEASAGRPAYLCTRCCRFDKLGAAAGNLCAAAAAAIAVAVAFIIDCSSGSNSCCLECAAANGALWEIRSIYLFKIECLQKFITDYNWELRIFSLRIFLNYLGS